MNKEPKIIINGVELSNAQAMTLRVAISQFIQDTNDNGLGDDAIGADIAKGYVENGKSVLKIIFGENLLTK